MSDRSWFYASQGQQQGPYPEIQLRDLIAFYQTPTGKKLLERQNVIAQQSMAAGQELGRAVVRDVQEQMQIKDQAK